MLQPAFFFVFRGRALRGDGPLRQHDGFAHGLRHRHIGLDDHLANLGHCTHIDHRNLHPRDEGQHGIRFRHGLSSSFPINLKGLYNDGKYPVRQP
jgi:hypothetical protein